MTRTFNRTHMKEVNDNKEYFSCLDRRIDLPIPAIWADSFQLCYSFRTWSTSILHFDFTR